MKFLTIDYIKQQLRIDWSEEDTLLDEYGKAAEDTLLNLLNRSYHDLLESYGEVPASLVQAAMLLVGESYQHREPSSAQNLSSVPYSFDLLIKPYMRLTSEPCWIRQQTVTLGSQEKILITSELPDDLTMQDVDFSVEVMNAEAKDKKKTFKKTECILTDEGDYVVIVDTDDYGVGTLMVKVTFQIPDKDFPDGVRKSVVRINPHITIRG
jgi:uncharacterized phage protein (predicted DNA packaging)